MKWVVNQTLFQQKKIQRMYLKDFENVGRVCLDCKSNIVAIANKEQKNWGFS